MTVGILFIAELLTRT